MKNWIWGLGCLGAICIVNAKERLAQKLRSIILFNFGLITFRSHFGKTRTPLMFMIFALVDVTMVPSTNYVKTFETPRYIE